MFIYREVVDQQCYLQEGIQINDGDVVMDIGANVGQYTLAWLAMRFRSMCSYTK